MDTGIFITVDYREKRSGIPEILVKDGIMVTFSTLQAGDYLINNEILIERKTAVDFVQSLIEGRLFSQSKKIRDSGLIGLFIIEGNLPETGHKINPEAIQGALLSIMVSWQIPVFFVADKLETVMTLIKISHLQNKKKVSTFPKNGKILKCHGSQTFFLQGLSSVGPELALRLLRHFGSVEKIATANLQELKSIEGIGKKKAEKLYAFFRKSY